MPDRLRQKSKWGAVRDNPTPGKRRCDACAKEHEVAGHTWLVIMSGHFVCDNNRCHTVMTNWLKEDTDAKTMDRRAARRAITKEESRVGKAQIR